MDTIHIPIKPLSVNQCWQGRRFKTKAYNIYEKKTLAMLPKLTIPQGRLTLTLEVGFSSKASDIDNILKPFIDILQKRYKFNDKHIYRLMVEKIIVPKGKEYIKFALNANT